MYRVSAFVTVTDKNTFSSRIQVVGNLVVSVSQILFLVEHFRLHNSRTRTHDLDRLVRCLRSICPAAV